MSPSPLAIWSFRGTIDRGPYAAWGVGLALLKLNLDRAIAGPGFGGALLLPYWATQPWLEAVAGEESRRGALLLLALTSAPFLWVAVALTVRRLRSCGMPVWLVLLLFVPALNLLLFALLCAAPPREEPHASPRPRNELARWAPRSTMGSAAAAVALVLPVGALLTGLAVRGLLTYGASLFLGIPFCMGVFSVVLHAVAAPRGLGECMAVSVTSVALLAGVLIGVAFEGLFCVLMAAPIAGAAAMAGGLLGFVLQWDGRRLRGVQALAVALPALLAAESALPPPPRTFTVRTAVEVDAPPERVWREVVAFSELPPPTELLFRAGIAHPLRAEIHGAGVGAVRLCVFSTGPFVEPITAWDAPRLLAFDVVAQPPPLRELSPWGAIDAPHLDGFLVSRRGQFLLEALPGGRTRLEGTTWYEHRIAPEAYWRLFSDPLIGAIHRRVLEHVRARAEAGP